MAAISSHVNSVCSRPQLRRVLQVKCEATHEEAADDAADSAALQRALRALQHPADCARAIAERPVFTFKDWR